MRIRALETPETKRIPLTANVFREDIEKCLDCGNEQPSRQTAQFRKCPVHTSRISEKTLTGGTTQSQIGPNHSLNAATFSERAASGVAHTV
jgi:hypothetical protein